MPHHGPQIIKSSLRLKYWISPMTREVKSSSRDSRIILTETGHSSEETPDHIHQGMRLTSRLATERCV